MIISLANHKGGTGKTTTALNLASGLVKNGQSVLLVDLDPQANLTYSLGILDPEYDVLDWLLARVSLQETILETGEMHLLPSSVRLYAKEPAFSLLSAHREHRLLSEALGEIAGRYDFILVDCPPSFSVFTVNALVASRYVLIPTLLDVLSLQGIDQVLAFISETAAARNPSLEVLGVLGINVDERRQLTYEVLEFIRDNYRVNIFNNYIRSNVKAAEAPSFAKSVIDYAPESNSAKDYVAFVREFMLAARQDQPVFSNQD